MAFDAAAAKAAGYSDGEIQLYLAQKAADDQASTHQAMPTPEAIPHDPSVGGGLLAVGPMQTNIPTPQWLDRTLSGAGRGMVHTGRSAGNLVGAVPDQTLATERETDAPLMQTGTGRIGNILGEAALTAPVGMGMGGALGRLGVGAFGNSAMQGATQGLLTADPGERLKNALLGGAAGGALPLATGAGRALVHGLSRSPEAQTLLNAGVDLTPGQMNQSGVMNQFEQAGESIPGVKQIVHGARENAEQQFQRAVIERGAAPGTVIRPSENLHDMLQQAYDSYEPLYSQAKGFPIKPVIMNTTSPDVSLVDAMNAATRVPGVPASIRKSAANWLQDRITKLGDSPDSGDILSLRSDIRARGRESALSTDIGAPDARRIYQSADGKLTQLLESQLPPEPLAALRTADSNYGNYKIVESAVAKSKDSVAGLTPAKLSQAIYDATSDPTYARGAGGDLRDLAQAGTNVFQTVSPPTGARVATLGAGMGAALASPKLAIPAATAGLGMVGTQTGRRLAQGATSPQVWAQGVGRQVDKSVMPEAQRVVKALLARSATGALMPATGTAAQAALAAALAGQQQ
jgi:hypothetical protein